jgi:hypothetical protein
MRVSGTLVALATAGIFVIVVAACGGDTLKAPKSDSNFDDPDEPPATGVIGAVDATTAESSADVVVQCKTTAECPTSFTCFFPVAQGCAATTGTCIVYIESAGCAQHTRCGCGGAPLRECSPEGYATAPVRQAGPCGGDAGVADAADAGD